MLYHLYVFLVSMMLELALELKYIQRKSINLNFNLDITFSLNMTKNACYKDPDSIRQKETKSRRFTFWQNPIRRRSGLCRVYEKNERKNFFHLVFAPLFPFLSGLQPERESERNKPFSVSPPPPPERDRTTFFFTTTKTNK